MMAQKTKPKLSSRGAMLLQHSRSGKATLHDLGDVSALEEVMAVLNYPVRRDVLVDLANTRGESGIEWFWRKWKVNFRPETTNNLIELGNDLREIWMFFSGEATQTEEIFPLDILSKWLDWRPSSEQLESYRSWPSGENEEVEQLLGISGRIYDYRPFFCSIFSGKLVPNPNCLRAMLIQGVFEHWRHFSYCANPDCSAPYFIAKRSDQTVCDAEICKAEKQREHARRWWNENRAKKGPKQEKVDSKPTMRRSRKNVTRKTR